jgi:hypothetical protein
MLFQLYSEHAVMQLIGWVLVFCGLILMNEIGRRTKVGGMAVFVIIPTVLTVYFILAHMGMFGGSENPTVAYMDGWFHYFKLYAADIGCVGFMMIKYKWGIGKEKWFKWFPWFIVAANIMIANVSDMESALAAFSITGDFSGAWWASNEGGGKTAEAGQIIADMGIFADPRAQGVVAMMSIVANVVCIAFIIQRSIKMGKNPYSNDVWAGTKEYEEAMARAEQEA